jgi:hypothetical protein
VLVHNCVMSFCAMVAGMSGVRHLRKLASRRGYRVLQLGRGEYHYD